MRVPRMSVTSPASASSLPRMILSNVDLPAPFGPTMATRSPDCNVSETSSNNSRPPNDLESPATVNMRNSFRLQLRKQNHVADAFLTEQHHAKPVNAHAHAAGGRHSVFERDEKILVQLLLLAAGLMFETFALLNRIILFRVARRNFLSVDAALEDFNGRRVVGRKFGERHEFFWQVRHKSRLN